MQLLEVTGFRQTAQSLFDKLAQDTVEAELQAMRREGTLTTDQEVAAYRERYRQTIDDARTRRLEASIVLAAQSYETLFTDDEVLALIAFYTSPVGQKMLATSQAMMQGKAQAWVELAQGLQSDIRLAFGRDRKPPVRVEVLTPP
jgi:hypothetical protein